MSLEYGLPKPWLEPRENRDVLQDEYGNFSVAVGDELIRMRTDFPRHIVTIGDNWLQLVVIKDNPTNLVERVFALRGFQIFADKWRIMDRDPKRPITHLLGELAEGVEAGMIDRTILERLAILDRASVAFPIFDESKITKSQAQPWGRIISISRVGTQIFHITSGFRRKHSTDLGNAGLDGFSASVMWDE